MTLTIWSWRWRQALRSMRWVTEGTFPAEHVPALIAAKLEAEPNVLFVASEKMPGRPRWNSETRKWEI